jgi:hypothetical protein
MHYDAQPKTTEHFRLVLGYDAASDEVIFNDPAVEDGAYKRMKKDLFLRLWPLAYAADHVTVIRFALRPGREIPDAPKGGGLAPADFAQHVLALKEKLPPGFHVVVEPPFVVVGDESAQKVKERAEHTVRWTVDRLKADFFTKDPERIIDVWILKDKASYERQARRLTGETPDTPYGFYTRSIDAMIMNIAPGDGTLVHEIVHPFVEANHPDCPAWFNEGLGSLYERPTDRRGHIYGKTNWRLPGLQHAIARGTAPSLKKLMSTTSEAFYGDDSGVNYAAARYLLYALQERGLLVRYYRELRKRAAEDPTGYDALLAVIGEKDLARFEPAWRKEVLALRVE